MLIRMRLKNCFRHADREIDFRKGLTGIIGPNESGKSLILEMIRYALFGTSALRGAATDHKKTYVELDFEVKGEAHRVVRSSKETILLKGDLPLATGTKPVNEAIINLFGYDMKVFDMANACNQGMVEQLGNLTPAERKRMVDQTIGLNVLDDLAKWVGEQLALTSRELAAKESMARQPVEPVKPEGMRPRTQVEEILSNLRQVSQRRAILIGKTANPPRMPEAPVQTVKETSAELEALEDQRLKVKRELVNIESQLSSLKPAPLTEEQIVALENLFEQHRRWVAKERLLAQGSHTCPACQHNWPHAHNELEAYADLKEAPPSPPAGVTEPMLRQWRTMLGNSERIEALKKEKEKVITILAGFTDRSADTMTARQYESALRAYQTLMADYETRKAQYDLDQSELAMLNPDVDQAVAQVQVELQQVIVYETQLQAYERDLAHYHEIAVQCQSLEQQVCEYTAARKAIVELKSRVKAYLLPSLNKVSSYLLNQMTGGARSTILIDEAFDITVDGQPLNTLSGSGKAVANLAIRIGLGQVLTNKVFSVFMGDELDASMDEERAEYTAQCLRRLTGSVQQVILVTHKRPETDHLIELTANGNSSSKAAA